MHPASGGEDRWIGAVRASGSSFRRAEMQAVRRDPSGPETQEDEPQMGTDQISAAPDLCLSGWVWGLIAWLRSIEDRSVARRERDSPSPTTTDRGVTMLKNGMRPFHPGEVLKHDYLVPLGLSAAALARAHRLPPSRLLDIVHGRRSVSADVAQRLARHFGGDARSWMNLQSAHDLRVAEGKHGRRVAREVAPSAA